jgi:hypothetical protein
MDTNATDGKMYGYVDVESYESFATKVKSRKGREDHGAEEADIERGD